MEPIPHTINLQNGHHQTPAFNEGRAGNVRTAMYEFAHEQWEVCPIRVVGRTVFGASAVAERNCSDISS